MEKPCKVKKPNPFLYYPLGYFIKLVAKIFFRLKVKKVGLKGEKGPFVIVSNHASTMDFPLLASAMLPKRVNIVAGKDIFTWKTLRPFVKTMGVIPKAQFGLDLASIRLMTAALKDGCSIVLYAEGKASNDGTNLHYLAPSIGKFLKMMGATVVGVKALGVYNTKRRFQKGFKRGRVTLEIEKLFGKEELKSATPQQIYERIVDKIAFNDNDYQIDNNIIYRGKNKAESLDFVLYKCPVCGKEYEMLGEKDVLRCLGCGNSLKFTAKGVFVPVGESKIVYNRIDTWYAWQREEVKKELLLAGDGFRLEEPVTLQIFDEGEGKYIEKGKGTFTLNKDEMVYDGTYGDDVIRECLNIAEMSSVCTKRCEMLTLPLGDNVWRLKLDNNRNATKITLYVEELYRIRHNL